ncbi:hypothetical protein F53441_4815 [Fusarium austroafricanum]|uniref:Lysine-specific metallo-endopeptidase domain-containing protein n=1 Tax=Fusarium austroafricanum TaxID=2364996 RepID=A0A8H4P8Z5_9HYPO|nr:hypothetical protein F53441_4815 [Fusarium austroafricanum]
MRFSGLLLLAGLSSSALAVDASLEPWEIDPSCKGFEQDIKNALTESIDLAGAARDSLNFVLARMPDRKSDPNGAIKWARISEAINAVFGFTPDLKGQGSTTKQFIEEMRDMYSLTAKTLPSSQNFPPNGFSPVLSKRPNAKPLIVCGDDVFKWYDADEEPEPGVGKVKDQKIFKDAEASGVTLAGAFYYKGRWDPRKTKAQSIGLCMGNRNALISSINDNLIICPTMLDAAGRARTTPRQYKASAALGDDIMSNWVSNPTQIYHELMHWFGGVDSKLKHRIQDHIAVDGKGLLRFKNAQGQEERYSRLPSGQELKQKGQRKQGAYGIKHIIYLAAPRDGNPYCGPKVATTNADSLAMFSFMMYLDQFDWSKGVARDMTRIKQKLHIP